MSACLVLRSGGFLGSFQGGAVSSEVLGQRLHVLAGSLHEANIPLQQLQIRLHPHVHSFTCPAAVFCSCI